MEAGALCRAVESYLRRKNDGHLIRIVGPAFEMVRGWAAAGIPLRVVERGIDRRYDRYYARGPKRHPLRIEFCEADVLDLFDEWKRAVGVGTSPGFGGGETETGAAGDEAGAAGDQAGAAGDEAGAAGVAGDEAAPRRTRPEGRGSLAKHLDALAARLSAWEPPPGAAALDGLLAEARAAVDDARSGGRALRGAARRGVIERLAALDGRFPAVARADAGDAVLREVEAEARLSLEPFRNRMPPPAFAAALEAATDRLLAERLRWPRLAFD